MSNILILMHNALNLKICAKVVGSFLKKNSIEAGVIVPQFAMPGDEPGEMITNIINLVEGQCS